MGRLRRNELALAAVDLETAVRLAPEDPRFLLGLAVLRSKQAKEASTAPDFGDLETRLVKRAQSGFHFAALAELALLRQDMAVALERAQRAVSLSPVHSTVLDVYAVVLAGVGRPNDAVAVEERAIAFLPDGGNASVLTKHLADFRARASRQ
jgi:Tfp pilus assembly protein PilF